MDTSEQHQTASKSIEEDIGHNTGSRLQAFTEQPDNMGMGTQGSATAAATDVKDITTEKGLLLEQQLEAATLQSQKHEERARYFSHFELYDVLNGHNMLFSWSGCEVRLPSLQKYTIYCLDSQK